MDHDEAIPFIYMILMGVVAFAAFVWYATVHQWFSAKARGAQPSEDPAMNRTSHWRVFWALVCMALIWFHATPLQSGYGGGSRGSYWSYRFFEQYLPFGKVRVLEIHYDYGNQVLHARLADQRSYWKLDTEREIPVHKYTDVPPDLIERMMNTRISSIGIYRREILGKHGETSVETMP